MQTLLPPPKPTDGHPSEFPRDAHRSRDQARERHRLLDRIHRKFRTVTEMIPLGPVTLNFTRIADPNYVLDQACAEEDRREKQTGIRLANPPHLPYWAELWESSRALARTIAQRTFPIMAHDAVGLPLRSHRVAYALDLGCGMGLAGAAASAMGFQTTLADLESPALLFARLNTLPYDANVRRLNWQTDTLRQKFDLILGADILYDRTQWPHLHAFWLSHLTPTGSILLTEPNRPSGDLFIPWARNEGWKLSHRSELLKPDKTIRTFRLTRHD